MKILANASVWLFADFFNLPLVSSVHWISAVALLFLEDESCRHNDPAPKKKDERYWTHIVLYKSEEAKFKINNKPNWIWRSKLIVK